MTSRRKLELDLARRAIAHAERLAAEAAAGDDVAERLRLAADDTGRLSVDDALAALARQQSGPTNPFAEQLAARRQRANARLADRYPPEPTDPGAA